MLQHPIIRYLVFSLGLAFISAGALAQSVGQRPEIYNSRPQTLIGTQYAPKCNLTNAATVLVNAAVCATNPTTQSPTLNTITLTQDSVFAFPTGLPTGGNFQFGFRIDHGTATCGGGGLRQCTATFAPGYSFPAASLTNGQPALSTGIDFIWCVSEAGSPPTVVDCSPSMVAMQPATAGTPSVIASTAGTFTENPPASTASVVQQLTAGDILIVAESNYNGTAITISSIVDSTQASNISGCTQFTGLSGIQNFSIFHCAIAATLTGGGNDTITATWSGTGQGYGLITAVVKNALANASLDDGIGAGGSSTITTGATSQPDLLLCVPYTQSITPIITSVTYNSGWTALQFGSDSNFATLGLASQTQAVAGTVTCTATWSGAPQFSSGVTVVGIK